MDAGPQPGALDRPFKRARSFPASEMDAGAKHKRREPGPGTREQGRSLLTLPDLILWRVLSFLGSSELQTMSSVSSYFRLRDDKSGLSVTNRLAKDALVRMVGSEKQAARWRGYSWIQKLAIEETATMFDLERAQQVPPGQQDPNLTFVFKEVTGSGVTEIKLDAPGPRMLVSNVSTADSPILRWKLQLRGNNAAEFGVIPVDLQETPKALHKCQPNKFDERATGFSSAITVGSLLPARLPIMKGTVVEILATPREVSFIVTNPEDGAEMIWQNNSTVSRPYKGPRELRLQLAMTYNSPIKLAVTAWQRAAFDVLHTMTPEQEQHRLAQPIKAQDQPQQLPHVQPQVQQPQQPQQPQQEAEGLVQQEAEGLVQEAEGLVQQDAVAAEPAAVQAPAAVIAHVALQAAVAAQVAADGVPPAGMPPAGMPAVDVLAE